MFHLISNIAAGLVFHEATQAAHRTSSKPERIEQIQYNIKKRRLYRDAELKKASNQRRARRAANY